MNTEDKKFITEQLAGLETRLGKKVGEEVEGLARMTKESFDTVFETLDNMRADLGTKLDGLKGVVERDHAYDLGKLKADVDRLKQHAGLS